MLIRRVWLLVVIQGELYDLAVADWLTIRAMLVGQMVRVRRGYIQVGHQFEGGPMLDGRIEEFLGGGRGYVIVRMARDWLDRENHVG